jgi:hypothetical protein
MRLDGQGLLCCNASATYPIREGSVWDCIPCDLAQVRAGFSVVLIVTLFLLVMHAGLHASDHPPACMNPLDSTCKAKGAEREDGQGM